MIGICLTAGLITASLPLSSFTLAWMHSIEKIRWEEDYRVVDSKPPRLMLTEARIRGSGAGMEPPADSVFKDGVWHYHPKLPPLEKLRLTHSPYTAGYQLCSAGRCSPLASALPGIKGTTVIELAPCAIR
jgi:hypothetical protein